MKVLALDWDSGNREKCARHGVSVAEIEQLLRNRPLVMRDPFPGEERHRAVGVTDEGRHVFLVFTFRQTSEGTRICPISVRFMHQREVNVYAQTAQTDAPLEE